MITSKFFFSSLASVGVLLLPSLCLGQVPAYTITNVIGTGTTGYTADGSVSSTAQLASPFGIALDSSGNLIIADQVNNRIRKLAGGSLSTVAGSGTAGFAGDGKSATDSATQINYPEGVAIDSSGNVYIADTSNCVIRKVAGGNISTVAGTSATCGYGGNNVPGTGNGVLINTPAAVALDSSGNLYIADTKNNMIRKLDSKGNLTDFAGNLSTDFGGDGVLATKASIYNPEGVAVDKAGNVYIADTGNHRIRKVDTKGIITTVAGNGLGKFAGDGGLAVNASLFHPKGVAVDAAGNLYIADTFNNRIRVVTNGAIVTIAGRTQGHSGDGGPALSAQLFGPVSLVLSSAGGIYFSDNQNHAIRLLTPVAGSAVPAIKAGGVVSATAFGGSTSVAPGSWIEIYGSNLASGARSWSGADFTGINAPTSLDGTRVLIGGQAAYVSYISPNQVNAQVPANVAAGQQPVLVSTAGGTSAAFTVTVQATQPALLAPAQFVVGGKQYVTAVFADGAFVAPPGSIPGVTSRQAKPGDTIILFGIGFGPTDTAPLAGQIVQGANQLKSLVQVMFGSTAAAVQYAGLAPNQVGLYQFNVVVPNVDANDAAPINVTLGGVALQQTLVTAVGK